MYINLDIDRAPVNMTVLLGRHATFRCSSVSIDPDSSTILWLLNETLIHQLPQEYDASSVSSQRTDAISGANSTLTVLGSEQTNGTQYRCGILDLATTTIANYSALVTLTVQGACIIHIIMVQNISTLCVPVFVHAYVPVIGPLHV